MKSIVQIVIILSVFSCGENPNYNPFDNQFNVSINQLANDNCDTISAGCGYYNLTQKKGNLKTYYQVYSEDFKKVLAKGFSYTLDTTSTITQNENDDINTIIDSIIKLPINREQVNKELGKFGYRLHLRNRELIQIENNNTLDTINLRMKHSLEVDSQYLIRYIDYFKPNKLNI